MNNKYLKELLNKLTSTLMEDAPPRLYRFRFLWCIEDEENESNKQFCFRVVEDVVEGILSTYEQLSLLPGLVAISCEYLGEYDASECGLVHNLFSPVDKIKEEIE